MLVKSSIVSSSLCERVREARRGREEEKRNLLNLLQPKSSPRSMTSDKQVYMLNKHA